MIVRIPSCSLKVRLISTTTETTHSRRRIDAVRKYCRRERKSRRRSTSMRLSRKRKEWEHGYRWMIVGRNDDRVEGYSRRLKAERRERVSTASLRSCGWLMRGVGWRGLSKRKRCWEGIEKRESLCLEYQPSLRRRCVYSGAQKFASYLSLLAISRKRKRIE